VEHVAAYQLLAFLPALHEKQRFATAAAMGAVALGVALEYVQLYSGWRDFEIGDMAADAIGVCLGTAAGFGLGSLRSVRWVLSDQWRSLLE
jgi:VanZ family protein